MGELNPYLRWVLTNIQQSGSTWVVIGVEGPRRPGHCIRCNAQCWGLTTDCEQRVWAESTNLLKEPRK